MAASKKSLVGRAGAAARKVVSRSAGASATADPVPAKKTAAKKTAAKKSAVKEATAKKATAKKATAKAPAKKTVTKTAKKTATTTAKQQDQQAPATTKAARTTSTKKTTAAPAAKKSASKKSAPTKAVPKKAAPKKTAPKKSAPKKSAAATATSLVVLDQEDAWTESEVAEVRDHLHDDVERLRTELAEVEGDLAGMIENPGEGAGHDQADVGSASFERDQERQIVNNARDMLEQSQHALARIDDGSYGQCESCGNPIGKKRLMAFPRATLCLTCKQREERR